MPDVMSEPLESSPFGAFLGLEVLEWREGYASIAYDVQPDHRNRSSILHGGLLLMLLDEVGGLCGAWPSAPSGPRRRSVTVNLQSSFTGQVNGGRVVATGQVVSHGRSLFFCQSEVRDAGNRLVAFASSTHRWRSEGVPTPQ